MVCLPRLVGLDEERGERPEMILRDFWRVIVRRSWIVILAIIATAALTTETLAARRANGALSRAQARPPEFESSSRPSMPASSGTGSRRAQ